MKTQIKKILGSILVMALLVSFIPSAALAEATVQLQALFVDQQYTYVDLYGLSNEGLAVVQKDGKYGYIDRTGQVAIPLQYDRVRPFSEGLAAVMQDGKYGYINTKGEMVIPFKYSRAESFNNGFAIVGINGKVGYINTKGDEVIPLNYTYITRLDNGYATATIYDVTPKKASWYLVNTSGFSKLIDCNSLSIVDGKYVSVQYKDGVSYFDLNLNPINFNNYSKIGVLSNGLVAASKDGAKFGYVDTKGNVVIPFDYVSAEPFDDNGIAIVAKEKCNYYAIDKTGKTVIQPDNYISIRRYYSYIKKENKKYYFLFKKDASGKNKMGCVDYQGNLIIPAIYDSIDSAEGVSDGFIAVMNAEKIGFADTKGNLVIPATYDAAGKFADGLAPVKKDGKWGYIDTQGNTVIPFEYDEVSNFVNSIAAVKKDGKVGAIDTSGNTVIPFEYKNIRDIYITADGLVWTVTYDDSTGFKLNKKYSLYLANKVAAPTQSTVLIDGKKVAFEAFNIDGSNYLKLRDIAKALNGSKKQFEIGWDASTNSITITTGKGYTTVGGELTVSGDTGNKAASVTDSKILLNGQVLNLKAYNINGSNYFKLRDLAASINFGVTWDESTNTIGIDTSSGYTK